MTQIEYSCLKDWKIPSDYGGRYWFGWYAVYSQHRDSDALTRSNYRRILEELSKLDSELKADDIHPRDTDSVDGDSTVTDTRVGHWAVGWAEIIYIHSSNVKACEMADEILSALEDYPVVDESDFSELEYEETAHWWDICGMRERISSCARAGVSIFAARRDSLSELPDELYQWLRDHQN